jgi:hypothetical protein
MIQLVGGRQSARTWHFISAFAFLAFVLVHVFMVLVTGPWNQVRAMITGRYRVPPDPQDAVRADATQPPPSRPSRGDSP